MDPVFVPRAVSISYFDPFEVFENVKEEFLGSIPFKNVHWKTPNGAVRTIDKLAINLKSETKVLKIEVDDVKLFIRFIVVNCLSVDEYRTKVRPLIRKWLPVDETLTYKADVLNSPMPLVLFYSNSEVVDSSLFKSVSLMDKLNKDFPSVNTLELRSVYKSDKEKQEFWNQLSYQLKTFVLDIFHQRLTYFLKELDALPGESEMFEDELALREKLVELYLVLNMHEQVTDLLDIIERKVVLHVKSELPKGSLDTLDILQDANSGCSIGKMLREKTLTKFQFHKYFFIRKFELLLQDSATTVRALKLYKLLRDYIYKMETIFKTDKNWLQFKYEFLNQTLVFLPLSHSIEIRGEILMCKRDCWIEGVLSSTNFKLFNKCFPKTKIAYNFDKYRDTFTNEETFHENYLSVTKEVLSLYNRCDGKRQRIVDILSVEIGNLHYQRGEFKKAIAIFLSCHEYYIQSKWDLIGKDILKTFVSSLIKSPSMDKLEIEGESVPVSTILRNALLHILKISDDSDERKEWCDEFFNIQKKDPVGLMLTMDDLFNVEVASHVRLVAPNTYALDVSIDYHKIPKDIEADTLKLTLKNPNDEFIIFEAHGVTVNESRKYYSLEAKEIKFGAFLPISFEFNIGTTIFTKQFVEVHTSWIQILPLYGPANVSFSIHQARELNLEENMLEIFFRNLDKVKLFELEISVAQIDTLSTFPVSFVKEKEVDTIKICSNQMRQRLPYYLKEPRTSFDIRTRFSFIKKSTDKKYAEEKTFTINCNLPISVSVEDIFKRDLFIFKFLLNASSFDEPIVLHSSKLLPPKNSHHYQISGEYNPESFEYLTADLNEYCLNCYQIETLQKFNATDTFSLVVTYNTLKEQLDQLVTDAVLVQGDFEWYSRFEVWKSFWELYVLPKLQYDYRSFQRNRHIVLNKGKFHVKDFVEYVEKLSIDKNVADKIVECLNNISRGVQLSEIDICAYTKNLITRKLIVPVEMPKLEQLFYVDLLASNDLPHEIGTPIQFTIKIDKIGAKWGQKVDLGTFVFEITNSNEWLVHGKKRMLLYAEHTELEIEIIPFKKGYLSFPQIEITNIECDELVPIDNPNMYENILVL